MQCSDGRFYGGAVVELEARGQPSRWGPEGLSEHRGFRKVDLLDLFEETTDAFRGSKAKQSPDDGGEPSALLRRVHNIATISASEQQLFVSPVVCSSATASVGPPGPRLSSSPRKRASTAWR